VTQLLDLPILLATALGMGVGVSDGRAFRIPRARHWPLFFGQFHFSSALPFLISGATKSVTLQNESPYVLEKKGQASDKFCHIQQLD
jgi:hypothetical protein